MPLQKMVCYQRFNYLCREFGIFLKLAAQPDLPALAITKEIAQGTSSGFFKKSFTISPMPPKQTPVVVSMQMSPSVSSNLDGSWHEGMLSACFEF